ncbi:ATP-binding protein [Niabella pedocola]|uniref:histidine kinase n=1 Tax=Niabella pedocola TaxID=1752077 RepID=A0ABS8PQE2_9BACT|nr:ATP-binding protein [Niabella pedocola]MCD2422046.1 ATP-binding protein [Niabella pedocola]
MDIQKSGLVDEERQALLAAIVSSSQDAIVSKTLKGIITSWNPAARRLFGYTEEEILGRHISLIIPEDRIHEEDFILEQIGRGLRIEHFETIRRAKSGRLIPISLTISPVFNERREIIGASKIARDISENIAAKKEKERLYEEVKTLSRKKDEFIALTAHELKTPITSLRGFMEVLQMHTDPENLHLGLIERCVRQTNKLTALMNDLLDVSRLQIGKLLLRREHFDIVAMVHEVLSGFTHAAKHQFDFRNQQPVMIDADRIRLEQVLTNLLNNAVKYTPAGGTVTLEVRETPDQVEVSVRDEGVGIDAEHLPRIFDQFYRAVDPGSHISGLGIGLYISKEIVVRHGGSIRVESRKGSGSVFIFSIPRQY